MKVLVAGATGAVGKPLVRQLVGAGHEVAGTTRAAERADRLHSMGAEPVVCDALDASALKEAIASTAPEVVINELTAIPAAPNPRKMVEEFELTNRLRREATATLAAACRESGVRRLISQSVAFAYAPTSGPAWTEEDPLQQAGEVTDALEALERETLSGDRVEGVVLRYGFFYGPGTSNSREGSVATQVRARRFPVIGGGRGLWPFIHVDDAAAATVAALDRGGAGIYNVVDDDPAPLREWLPYLAEVLGAPRPWHVPRLVARLVAGPQIVYYATALQPVSNAKAKRELGWQPGYPSWRQGFRDGLG